MTWDFIDRCWNQNPRFRLSAEILRRGFQESQLEYQRRKAQGEIDAMHEECIIALPSPTKADTNCRHSQATLGLTRNDQDFLTNCAKNAVGNDYSQIPCISRTVSGNPKATTATGAMPPCFSARTREGWQP